MPDLPLEIAAAVSALLAEVESLRAPAPEGLSPQAAATLIGVSPAKLHDMNARGLMPAPVELGTGRCPRYLRSELFAWLRAGAPPRAKWHGMRDAALRRDR